MTMKLNSVWLKHSLVVGLVSFVNRRRRAETGPIKDWDEPNKPNSIYPSVFQSISKYNFFATEASISGGSGLSIEQANTLKCRHRDGKEPSEVCPSLQR